MATALGTTKRSLTINAVPSKVGARPGFAANSLTSKGLVPSPAMANNTPLTDQAMTINLIPSGPTCLGTIAVHSAVGSRSRPVRAGWVGEMAVISRQHRRSRGTGLATMRDQGPFQHGTTIHPFPGSAHFTAGEAPIDWTRR